MPKCRVRKCLRCNPASLSVVKTRQSCNPGTVVEKKMARPLQAGDNEPKSTQFSRNQTKFSRNHLLCCLDGRIHVRFRTRMAQMELNVGPPRNTGPPGLLERVRMNCP